MDELTVCSSQEAGDSSAGWREGCVSRCCARKLLPTQSRGSSSVMIYEQRTAVAVAAVGARLCKCVHLNWRISWMCDDDGAD